MEQQAGETCQWCFTKDNIVAGHYKEISAYSKGEQCLSLDGLTEIQETFVRPYHDKLIIVKGCGLLPISVTPEHLFLVITRKGRLTARCSFNAKQLSEPYWKKASDLQPIHKSNAGDYLIVPRNQKCTDTTYLDLLQFAASSRGIKVANAKGVPTHLLLDEDLAWLIGLYIAEGYSSTKQAHFCLNKGEMQLQAKLRSIISNMGYSSSIVTVNNEIRIILASRMFSRALRIWCGERATQKCVPDFILYHQNQNILRATLEGYWCGDGYKVPNKQHFLANTVSKKLALQLQFALARIGYAASLRIVENPRQKIMERVVNAKSLYYIAYSPQRKKRRLVITDEYLLAPVSQITYQNHSGDVYNLSTSTKTYIVNNVVVHNCHSMVDAMQIHSRFCPSLELSDRVKELERKMTEVSFEFDDTLLIAAGFILAIIEDK